MGTMGKWIFVFLLPLTSAWAQTATLQYCYGGGCANPAYQGPMGSYQTPGQNLTDLNQRHYEAYRYGKTQELENYRQDVENKIVALEVAKIEGQVSAAQLETITAQVHANLDQNYPVVPQSVLEMNHRRALNPLPPGTVEEKLQKHLDGVWEGVKSSEPFVAVKELAKLTHAGVPIPGTSIAALPEVERVFLEKELRLSGITNTQGLLVAPYAHTPENFLYTSNTTFIGADIRFGINQLLATQSALGAKCVNNEDARCAEAAAALDANIAAYYALDRLVAAQGLRSPEVFALSDELRAVAEFSFGVGQGVWNGTLTTVTGLVQIVTHMPESLRALGHAIANYEQTGKAIVNALEARYDQLIQGTASQRGEVIGEALFEVGSLLIPVSQLSKLSKGANIAKVGLYEAAAQSLSRSAKLSQVLTPVEVRAYLVASRLELKGAQVGEFMGWAKTYLNVGDQGELAISFARRVTPERYEFLRAIQTELGADASTASKSYLTQQLTYEGRILAGKQFSSGDLKNMSSLYDHLDGKMATVSGKTAPAEGYSATRGIHKTYNFYGIERANTTADVFQIHRPGEFASHRYSQPGQEALYTSTGPHAVANIEKEAGLAANDLLWGQQVFHPQKILDLSDPAVRGQLGVTHADLIIGTGEASHPYLQTQIIGDLAHRHGFDAILAPSKSDLPQTLNLILLP